MDKIEKRVLVENLHLNVLYRKKDNKLIFQVQSYSSEHFLVFPINFSELENLSYVFSVKRVLYIRPFGKRYLCVLQPDKSNIIYHYQFTRPSVYSSNVIVEEKSFCEGNITIRGVYFSKVNRVVLAAKNNFFTRVVVNVKVDRLVNMERDYLDYEDEDNLEITIPSEEVRGVCTLAIKDPSLRWKYDFVFQKHIFKDKSVIEKREIGDSLYLFERKDENTEEIHVEILNKSGSLKIIPKIVFKNIEKYKITYSKINAFISGNSNKKVVLASLLRKEEFEPQMKNKGKDDVMDYGFSCKVLGTKLVHNFKSKNLRILGYKLETSKRICTVFEIFNDSSLTYNVWLQFTHLVNCRVHVYSNYDEYNRATVSAQKKSVIFGSVIAKDPNKHYTYKYLVFSEKVVKLVCDTPRSKRREQKKKFDESFQKISNLEDELTIIGLCGNGLNSPDIEEESPVVKRIKENSSKIFVDGDFPPSKRSIYPKYYTGKRDFFDKIGWVQANMILGKNFQIFHDEIEMADILQGEVGDCWFLSSVAGLAQYPKYIRKLFVTEESNEVGVYEVMFCVSGEWIRVVVDSFFPVIKGTRHPMFSRNHDSELWAMLLEKAYAKIHGGYVMLHFGSAKDSLRDISGCPVDFSLIRKENSLGLKKIIEEGLEKGYIITAVSNTNAKEDELGILNCHYYTVYKIKTLGHLTLIKLRNPWGYYEWKGDYSDKSKKWTQHLKGEFGFKDMDDGKFWMPYSDFIDSYAQMCVCKINVNWKEYRKEMLYVDDSFGKGESFDFTAKKGTTLIAGVHQSDRRFTLQKNKGIVIPYAGIGVKIFLIRKIGKKKLLAETRCITTNSVDSPEITLKENGKYRILPVVHEKDIHLRVIVSLHADKDVVVITK